MTNSLLILLPVLVTVLGALVVIAAEPFLQNENKHMFTVRAAIYSESTVTPFSA